MIRAARVLALATLAAAPLAYAATPDDAYRAQRRDAVVRAVEKVGPAVVNISTEVVTRPEDYFDPFEFFFGRGQPQRNRVEHSLGSGVIVDAEGHVLTNDHVVSMASKITVTLADQREVEADLVGSDKASDLAVLKLKGKGPWPVCPMGRSDDLMIGETVIAIGNPFGLQSTVTVGVLSALGRTLASPDETQYADFLQTDAAINPGNSGGALLDVMGELIGINSQILGRGAQNLGFAIPIDRARKVFREIVSYGKVRPTFTGLILEDLDARDAREMGLGDVKGVLVRKRLGDSPAERADIRAGDVITAVDGQRVTSVAEFDTALARANFGSTVAVRLNRDGAEQNRSLAVVAFPRDKAPQFAWNLLGFTVTTKGKKAVVEKVREDGVAAEAGIAPGMAVAQLNGKDVDGADAFYDAIPDAVYRRTANLIIEARNGWYRLSLPLTPVAQSRRPRR